ncbi:DUF1449 family protein [Arenicella xantha]|uniref:Uncharacterized protein DUF1449 n=1 Tax=Arenicella xantha TaxID=644221 RepID=A0A395JJQ2_9GAMM|nr:DUF1449 family protein [Arenicella xantha]RBP51013.1 uncharacterized protein DUF1449 [Arenicella xantha]
MFAIFLHESMNPFHQTVTSFPTVIYTILLIICAIYWLVAVMGLVEIDILDFDLDGDIDAADSTSLQEGIAGILHRIGLAGVPLTVVLTIIACIGWLLCYYTTYFIRPLLPDVTLIRLALGLVTFVVATYITVLTTAQILKPIRSLFQRLDYDETKYILGQTVVVRSSIVNRDRGEAELNDGGAGLLLNVRATGDEQFTKGQEVVVIEQLEDQNLFRVVAKAEFGSTE